MQVYRIVSSEAGPVEKYFDGATESSKRARELSKAEGAEDVEFSVYEFTTPKTYIDKDTFLLALNEEQWCEPEIIASFIAGRAKK